MTGMGPVTVASLQSQDHGEILDTIDDVRSQGINRFVQIPQIIVCGDQSSGKSSVLNAASGIQFPAKDNLCTRFATEVILRRTKDVTIAISIIPGSTRSEEDRIRLSKFSNQNGDLENVPAIIEAAKEAMGLQADEKAFSDDILRIEVFGPDKPQLTLVDLPGLIHSENRQQSAEDVRLVSDLVKSYMNNPRSIILAVVSAKNDPANQVVTRLAREVDPHGRRTLGIITKPDTLHVGSESEAAFMELAKNDHVTFRLGWHVLKNRDWNTRDYSAEQRDKDESTFLSQGVWAKLPRSCVGISTLNSRLSKVLMEHILSELPNLISDVEAGIKDSRKRLDKLGIARDTPHEMRGYLVRISESFCSLVRTAVDGAYVDEYFGDAESQDGYSKRFRAVVQRHLSEFEEEMREEGHWQEIVADEAKLDEDNTAKIKRHEYLNGVRHLMRRTRGRELPGTFNPLLIGDLFFRQAQHWRRIASEYRAKILDSANVFLILTMKHTMDDITKERLNRHVFGASMERLIESLDAKLAETLKPHERGHPITYNHYFIEIVQTAREEVAKKEALKRLNAFFKRSQTAFPTSVNLQSVDLQQLAEALSRTTEPDMELFACSEATDCMLAYYKVALKIFVDSFATQVVEFCVMEKLGHIFTPTLVTSLSDEVVHEIASESKEAKAERNLLREKLAVLEQGLQTLRLLTSQRLSGSAVEDNVQDTDVDKLAESGVKDDPSTGSVASSPHDVSNVTTVANPVTDETNNPDTLSSVNGPPWDVDSWLGSDVLARVKKKANARRLP